MIYADWIMLAISLYLAFRLGWIVGFRYADKMWLKSSRVHDERPVMTGSDVSKVFRPLPENEAKLLRDYGQGDPDHDGPGTDG